jgi:hypothetical protein
LALTLTFAGKATFFAWHDHPAGKLPVAVRCRFGDLPPMHALLDTAAQWSVIPADLARQLGCSTEPDPDAPRYWTRRALLEGRLEQVQVSFPAEVGQAATVVEATFYVSDQWDGPPVIGWGLCLELLPFALDPRQHEEFFYFGMPADE